MDELDFRWASDTFDAFVRGDALIGLMPDAGETGRTLLRTLWRHAGAGHRGAWTLLGRVYLAVEQPIGAFDGLLPTGDEQWPTERTVGEPSPTPLGAAIRCFAEAAQAGDRDGLLLLARCARRTDDVTRALALELLRLHAGPDADGTFAYEEGLLRWWSADRDQAVLRYHQAADKGNRDAAFELFVVYANGEGAAADPEQARTWLQRAADRGQPRAMYNLGAFHATGHRGFPQDWERAVAWYTRAAEQGNARAATSLATMYLLGDGVPPDAAQAARWLSVAEEVGVDVVGMLEDLGVPDPRG